ncbi:MAG: hypothetical protein IJT14_01340 [Rickettsiales bacterium]|nr:hypothetical protein [Rickettsiales bacterium]
MALIPIGVISLRLWVGKKNAMTDEQKKVADVRVIKYILFYWICVLFYLMSFKHYLVGQFILGIIILAILFYNLCKALSNVRKKSGVEIAGMIQDFIIGMVLSVYLIYLIPNKEVQNIVIPIVAAVYGGLLTLTGVYWTIRHTAYEKHKDELAKAVPLFTFVLFAEVEPQAYSRKTCIVEGNGTARSFAEFENSNRAAFYIRRVYFDESWHNVNANNMLLPNDKLLIEMRRNDIVEHPIMEIEDLYERKYYYDLMFCMMPGIIQAAMFPTRFTLCELKEISAEEAQKRITNLNKFELNNSDDKKEA